jgi:hypothetical protein
MGEGPQLYSKNSNARPPRVRMRSGTRPVGALQAPVGEGIALLGVRGPTALRHANVPGDVGRKPALRSRGREAYALPEAES